MSSLKRPSDFGDYQSSRKKHKSNSNLSQAKGAVKGNSTHPDSKVVDSRNLFSSERKTGKSGLQCYPALATSFWSFLPTDMEFLYPTILVVYSASTLAKFCAPISILTRRPLPDFDGLKVFFSKVPSQVRLLKADPVKLDSGRLHLLGMFTVRLCRLVTNKHLACALDNIPYFFAPLRLDWDPGNTSILDEISWEIIGEAANSSSLAINTGPVDTLEQGLHDAIVQDGGAEFARRFEVIQVKKDRITHETINVISRESNSENMPEISERTSEAFTGSLEYEHPSLEVSLFELHANCLNPSIPDTSKEPTKRSAISVLRTASLVPSVLRRINDLLLVKELNSILFNNVLSGKLLHTAITCPSAKMDFDYERFEFLGDSVLKYVASVYIISCYPSRPGMNIHCTRQQMVNNKSLMQNALEAGLVPYIQSRPFVPRQWKPPNFEVFPDKAYPSTLLIGKGLDVSRKKGPNENFPDEIQKEETIHWLGDKMIADVAEAIIGAGYLSGGIEAAFRVMKALRIPLPMMDSMSDLRPEALSKSLPLAEIGDDVRTSIEILIGHKCDKSQLLAHALLHKPRKPTIVEHLEFLGDAVLEFLCTRYVFDQNEHLLPEGLTLFKSAMMSNSTLAAIAVWSGISEFIRCEKEEAQAIKSYSDKVTFKAIEAHQLKQGIARQYWRGLQPPAALASLLKTIMGAIHMSDNFSFIGVENMFRNVLQPFYDKHIINV
ncbi:hypothetical protein AMATHDRAFT_3093 [Amanita thiersii Skay4041]|uniref:RNase III domain-containing protein n=1 Tax=Amanita thiersii Skay4041 TaxID=703135 RepID=A0A2A9NT48_9AGAR|nr:hypothetical protein AMATHDRAFT_3093 [Amanita thiersii Skay4041]